MLTINPKSIGKALRELKPKYHAEHNIPAFYYLLVCGDETGVYILYIDLEVEGNYRRAELSGSGEGYYPIMPRIIRDIGKVSTGDITIDENKKMYKVLVNADGCTWTLESISVDDFPAFKKQEPPTKPIRVDHQIDDAITGYISPEVKEKIAYTNRNIDRVLRVNGKRVYNPIVEDDNIFFTLRRSSNTEYRYPIQFATIEYAEVKHKPIPSVDLYIPSGTFNSYAELAAAIMKG